MVQGLRGQVSLSQDPGLILSTHVSAIIIRNSCSRESNILLWPP